MIKPIPAIFIQVWQSDIQSAYAGVAVVAGGIDTCADGEEVSTVIDSNASIYF